MSRPRFLLVASILFLGTAARAQITNVTNATSTPTPGVGHDYIHLLSETVDPVNGGVSLRIAIPQPPARGLNLPFAFTYDSNSSGLQPKPSVPNVLVWGYQQNVFAAGPWSNTLPQLTAQLQAYYDQPSRTACFSTTGYVFSDPSGGRHALGLSAILSNQNANADPACHHRFDYGLWQNSLSGGDDFLKAVLNGTPTSGYSDLSNAGSGAGEVRVADASGAVYIFNNRPPQQLPPSWRCGPPS